MPPIPVGILTRDRFRFLSLTLRSLAATEEASKLAVTIFDDGSSTNVRDLYETAKRVQVPTIWPTDVSWKNAGMSEQLQHDLMLPGFNQSVRWEPISNAGAPIGVVAASMAALDSMFSQYPAAKGVYLLQDDIVFNADWLSRMRAGVADVERLKRPLGILAGLKLNQRFNTQLPIAESGITAQCLYVTHDAYSAVKPHMSQYFRSRLRFDDNIRRLAAAEGFWCGCVLPFVCQHFGIDSLVRPWKSWTFHKRGRLGYHNVLPYVMAPELPAVVFDQTWKKGR